MSRFIRVGRSLFGLILISVLACSDSPTESPNLPPVPASMQVVSGGGQYGLVGTELAEPLVVRVLDAQGTPIPSQIVNFRVLEGGGSVFAGTSLTDAEGKAADWLTLGAEPGTNVVEARAVDPGSAQQLVFARFEAEGLLQEPVASVSVTPDSVLLTVGATTTLYAHLLDQHGDTLDRSLAWSTSDEGVATVSASGDVTGVAPGSATVRAQSEGVSGQATVVVENQDTEPPAMPKRLKVVTSTMTQDTFRVETTWGWDDEADHYDLETGAESGAWFTKLQVADSAAQLAAPYAGSAGGFWLCLRAVDAAGNASDPRCTSYSAPPPPEPVASVTVTPADTTVTAGSAVAFVARTFDASGAELQGRAVTWTSSNAGVATVDADGGASALSAGTAQIEAHSEGVTGRATLTVQSEAASSLAHECDSPSAAWLWCDDFDRDRLASYFEIHDAGGSLVRAQGAGQGGSHAMEATWSAGQTDAGNLKLAFGKSPDPGYVVPVDGGELRYRDVYWRIFVRTQAGWSGHGADKLSRASVLANSAWGQAAIGHVWTPAGGSLPHLLLDPARGTDEAGTLVATTFNDFANLTFLGATEGSTPLFSAGNADTWFCVEAHMRLNDAGLSNGEFEFWVDENLEARQTGLNWLGAYADHGINAIFFENYWNSGSPVAQSRYFDNVVVSTERIGCGGGSPGGTAPVAVVEISGGNAVSVGSGLDLGAVLKDRTGAIHSGSVTWISSDPAVATVDASGVVTGVAAGSVGIIAESSNGKRGSRMVTVEAAPAAPTVTTTALPDATVSEPYDRMLEATGGEGSYSWSLAAGSLPDGLTLHGTEGRISGTPTASKSAAFTVRVESGGQTDLQDLSLTVQEAPTGGTSPVPPFLLEDFSTYADASELLSDPRGIWDHVEGKGQEHISLDHSVGYGGSDRSMRYDWPDIGSVCNDYAIRPGFLQIPGNNKHLWVEYVVRFSPDFEVDHGASGCAAEYKLAAMGDLGGIHRWNVPQMQGHRWVLGYPNDVYVDYDMTPSDLWDGEPHVIRLEVKLGPKGILRYWVDGVLVDERTGFTTDSSHGKINYFAPGLNLNQGPGIPGMKTWWHRIAVYDQDPGW